MNNFARKIYNHKKLEGNILILVILIMLTVAMMGLLTMSFLKQMFSYTINLDGYYKSYYISKAGLELALVDIDNSDIGFSDQITGTNTIFTTNLCANGDCSVNLKIVGKSKFLSEKFFESTECTDDTAFTLVAGESFALPLFYQQEGLSNNDILQGLGQENTTSIISEIQNSIHLEFPHDYPPTSKLNLSLVFPSLEGQLDNLYIATYKMENDTISAFSNGLSHNNINVDQLKSQINQGMLEPKIYLMISNANNYPISFCIQAKNDLPTTKFYVVSLGNYQGKYVGMQAIYAQPIPSFMFYGYNGD